MAVVSNKKYHRLFIQLTALIILAVIILYLIKHNDTSDKLLETSIKPHSPSKNVGLISDLHTITCAILPVLGEICLNHYSIQDMVNKDLFQNKHKHKNSYKKWFQFGLSKYIIIKRVNDIDDTILDNIYSTIPTNKEYKKLTLLDQTLYLTYKEDTSKTVVEGGIKNIDVLFGKTCVEVRDDYSILKDVIINNNNNGDTVEMYLSLQKLKADQINNPTTIKNKDIVPVDVETQIDNYKIMQIADLHYAIGPGVCRDPFPQEKYGEVCEADVITDKFISKLLDNENPDFVVFTGDQIMDGLCTQDSETCLLKVVKPLIDRKIKYTFIWGNHDDEGSLSREQISEFAATLPYSYYSHQKVGKNPDKFGYGNTIIKFVDSQNEDNVLMKFFLLDSHKYSSEPKVYPGYDWIKEEQWEYLTKVNDKSDKTLNAAFYHIPLPEYRSSSLQITNGQLKEGITAPKYDYGTVQTFFNENDIVFGSCGHDHVNDFCGEIDGKWLCYGGASGMGGYAGYGGFERRVRFFDINLATKEIQTYKRVMGDENNKLDLFTLN